MAECEKVCKYIDLPLQHASNPVLKRMKRPGTRQSYETLLDRIRTRVPGVALRTTFIVGFPGETEADVEELTDFVPAQAFDHVGVFTYSHEEGTSAHALENDVPERSKQARRRRVMSLQKRGVQQRQRRRVGERARVLIDGPSGEHELVREGAAGDPGAGYRRGGLPDRLRPVELPARGLCRRHHCGRAGTTI